MYAAPAHAYQSGAVSTASPAQLVLMCYDGVLAAITRARQSEQPEVRNTELQRAQSIISELQVTLNHDLGGQIARSLASLYAYAQELLVAANVSGDLSRLDGVTGIVSELRGAWAESCCGAAAVS